MMLLFTYRIFNLQNLVLRTEQAPYPASPRRTRVERMELPSSKPLAQINHATKARQAD